MKKVKRELPGIVKFFLGLISFALCLCLIVCSIVTILVADLSMMTSKVGLQELVKDLLFTSAPASRPAPAPAGMTMVNSANGFGSMGLDDLMNGGDMESLITELFYEALGGDNPETLPFTKEELANFVEQSTIPEFASDKLASLVSDVLLGEANTSITVDDIMNLVTENKDLIEDLVKEELPDEIVQELETELKEAFGDGNLADMLRGEINKNLGLEGNQQNQAPVSPDNNGSSDSNNESSDDVNINEGNNETFDKGFLATIDDVHFQAGLDLIAGIAAGNPLNFGMPQILTMLRFVTSMPVLIALMLVCLAIVVLLFLFNWGRPGTALIWTGVALLISGGLTAMPVALVGALPSLLPLPVGIGGSLQLLLYINGGVAALGFILIIIGGAIGSAMRKRRLKAAAFARRDYVYEQIDIHPAPAAYTVPEITEDEIPEDEDDDVPEDEDDDPAEDATDVETVEF